jgi:YesN/AraC family two-component response regulator
MTKQKIYDLRVLYAEDDAVTREEISLFLKRRAKEVILAANGAEGLELYRRNSPDIIVTDIRMPVMDGLKMLRAIRQENRSIPIIVTSAYSDTAYMMEAIDLGSDQYVLKPVDTEKLSAAFEKCAEMIEHRKTALRYAEEREHLIKELQAALAEVKLLSGFLHICSSCKKIRDDEGHWMQIEKYISDHSEAEFSDSLCPDCATKLYPDYRK